MGLVRSTFGVLLCLVFCSVSPAAQNPGDMPVNLLDHLAGRWVLQGTIAGGPTTHDIEATWVLNREYLELHEISREKNNSGKAAYEAIVYLSWDVKAQQYTCLWLDSTTGGGLSAEGMGRAKWAGDAIPLLFSTSPADQVRTNFKYDKTSDSWQWVIDNVENGRERRFATVTLTRAKQG